MKHLRLPLLLATLTSLLLTSCGTVQKAWGEAYRHRGGYYDKPEGQGAVHGDK